QQLGQAAGHKARHEKSGGLCVVSEGALRVEQADPFRAGHSNLLFQRGHRQRPRLRPWRIRAWPTPIAYCPLMAVLPPKTIQSRMPPPVGRWSWILHWPISMLFWEAMSWSTTGILREERPNSRRL